jgi:DNA-binding CsgD family transcriptional regulator
VCDAASVDAVRAAAGVADGYAALAAGDWTVARDAFDAALDAGGDVDPEALDGRGRALWWLRDAEGAIASRERAYAGFRRDGELARAARIALWLSREYATVWGNEPVAGGWLARAERLLRDVAPGAEQGWLLLARAERTQDARASAELAAAAIDVAAAAGDVDLEIRGLAQLGLARVATGDVDAGLAHLDEAMAAASAGEPTSLETFADVCCALMLACDLAHDVERPRQWGQVVDAFLQRYEHVPLLAFCRTCCADMHAARGRIDEAEEELTSAIRELEAAGQRSRCAHPASRLAQIRVLQGRLEEADELLRGLEGAPETVEAAAALRLARGEPAAAASVLEQRLDELGRDSLVAVPLLSLLVEARVALGDTASGAAAAAALASVAVPGGRSEAAADVARGRVAAARGEDEAAAAFGRAAELYRRVGLPLDSARARLELARALAPTEPELAIDVARRAHRELESLGADRAAADASALLRSLGAKSRSGPRGVEVLTKREQEVLRLLGEGLSNAELGRRLFISPKTAEHHVGRILRKLDLRSRAEAAGYAARHGGAE